MKGYQLSGVSRGVIAIENLDFDGHQTVGLSIASALSSALVVGAVYRVWASVACFIKTGTSAVSATTSDFPLGPQVDKYITIDAGNEYVAGIVSSGTGVLYITRLK